ncbi:MAG: SRPBCC domain-containing protein [Solirubrobacteraceae bacterium]
MTRDATTYQEPEPELRRTTIDAGEARVAVFTRTYPTTVEDLWDACTNPERLRRWYVPVTGDLRLGGTFQQVNMGSGTIVACEEPRLLRLSLGNGADEIELRLSSGVDDGTARLELQHATTLDSHNIGGQMYDAIFCMGGGYYPRLLALDLHLRGTLPEDYDSAAFHLNPEMHSTIERGSAAMAALLEADAEKSPGRI